ncbi:hypothetical protein FMN50_16760 [Rhodobacterales bacterium]|nr:hypothetical protein FMN50_16760 [Rhodobacterales bacterium]
MSVSSFAILSSQQNAFGRTNGAARDGTTLLKASETLAKALSGTPGSEDEERARSLFETFKDSVEISSQLARSAEQSRDSARSEKVSKLKQRIEQLKEMLRFATPEQAKRMLKELKQISREFKAAAKDLGNASSAAAGGTGGAAAMANSGAGVSGIVNAGETSPGGEVSTVAATSALSEDPAATANGAPAASALSDTGTTGSSQDDNQTGVPGEEQPEEDARDTKDTASWKADLTSAIQSYTEQKRDNDRAEKAGRQAALDQERDVLRKLARDIKQLAKQLKSKAEEDEDDRKSNEDYKAVARNLQDAERELNRFEIQPASGPTSQDVGSATGTATYSATTTLPATTIAAAAFSAPVSDILV